ncbi:MaoC/PaaZ C-terminal domain-containing protein [Nocardioides sp. S-58]|uniref:MaoC/PaaZ C-terminal domain-containing protein n=1 Tax=Nocardioides renjunii TaxID=3095075 RepID=A0ABU5KC41_9ACTN|nr:MaoC/PaaZ C-terminal domain-containing protein [Nocardioides sp. S-58]MDZ5661990.1 MaoC/PaaZ C-terminal domain-containing protein [Nocardioides sp. S-58]
MPGTRTLDGEPGGITTLVRAALPALPVVNRLPGVRKRPADQFGGLTWSRRGVAVQRARVDAYAAVCGFPRKDVVPLTYPHLLAFPLHTAIMADPAFPYPAVGLVHVENTITAHRAIVVGEEVDVTTAAGTPRPHAKGVLLDFVTTVSGGGGTAWESTSTYLRRGHTTDGEPRPGLTLPDPPTGGVEWRLPADLGRTYAGVSGDANPIHLWPLTAKALGFPRQIAHGMWTKARSVAAIENRLPEAVTVEVAFKKPVLLPGTVAYAARREADGWAFAVTSPRDASPHLVGRTTSA